MKRLTNEEFIKKVKNTHGTKYVYIKTNYINSSTKVIITCNIHGDFLQLPLDHLKTYGCAKCSNCVKKIIRTKSKNQFIIDAINKHKDRYGYLKVDYISSTVKIVITCKKHGDFKQRPSCHLSGKGCPTCSFETFRYTNLQFIEKSNIIHNNKYNYSNTNYTIGKNKVIIICPIHGSFEKIASSHLGGFGCNRCSWDKYRKSSKQFIAESINLHGNKYDYHSTKYLNKRLKVIINCKEHGNFSQTPNNHLAGNGCPKCSLEPSWSRSEYIKKAKGRICTFYVIRCFNKNEEFYKVGITILPIKKRYNGVLRMPYSYEIISENKGDSDFIWDLEKKIKRKLKDFNYQPFLKFGGSITECFTKYEI